ncbi:MAG: MurR/RpiR family transcriptional regulator [Planctomycetota bacterium]|jgi:DNA-binding MurR/RpiR family transcriptional regulator
MSLHDLIASTSDSLTPTERRIARIVLEDPTLLAFGTVSDLAERVETSRPSIVRFATKLGFDGYPQLQRSVREEVARRLSTPAHRVRQTRAGHPHLHSQIESSVHQTLEQLDEDRLRTLAQPLVSAESIWILSGETSRGGAIVLQSGLSMVRGGVHLVDDHDIGRDLSNATSRDAAVVFDFARYRRDTVLAARAVAELGVDLIAITDGPLSPYASVTPNWLGIEIPAVGPFDSSMTSVVVAELMVTHVVNGLGDSARASIDRLENLWAGTRTFWGDGE